MSSRRSLGALWTLLALAGCGTGAVARTEDVPSPGGPIRVAASGWVRTAPVTAEAVPTRVEAPGVVAVRAEADARISVPVPGRVREVHVREGARVEAGAPLVTLASAEAGRLRAELAAMEVELRAAEAEVARQQRLADSGVGLEVERLRAEAEAQRARAAVTAARAAVALLGGGAGDTVVLRAPLAGVVVDVDARPGLVVTPEGGPLVAVAHTAALHVRLDVYEDELRRVRPGQRVRVMGTNGLGEAEGSVVEVADVADPATRRGPALVELDAVPEGWVAGRMVRGRVDAAPAAHLAVPVSAVVVRPDKRRVVYVEEADGLVARPVQVGRVVDGLVPVLSGLVGDERVVVEGALLVDALADRML